MDHLRILNRSFSVCEEWNRHFFISIIFCALLAILTTEPVRAGASAIQSTSVIENNLTLPQTDYDLLLSLASERAAPTGLSSEVFNSINTWIAGTFNLPAVSDQPSIKFEDHGNIVAFRYPGFLSAPGIDMAARNTVAVYSDISQTIYLPQGWTGSTAAELSILVHEMIHHFQNVLGLKHECPQEREKLAYAAQDRWLGLFGETLESAFEIDPLSLLVHTKCMH